jgi:hypothetical protein
MTEVRNQPYAVSTAEALKGVAEVRRFAMEEMRICFDDYLRANLLLAWTLRDRKGLNQPFLYGSIAVIAQRLGYHT